MVTATVKYCKPGVRPPVYVAGSFTDPEWVPREMNWGLDEMGQSLFTTEVEVEADRDYQYKFKVGYGNDWDLDEQSPTTSDNMGNKNNLLVISSRSQLEDNQQHHNLFDNPRYSPHIASSEQAPSTLAMQSPSAEINKSSGSKRNEAVPEFKPSKNGSDHQTPELCVSNDSSRMDPSTEQDEVPSTPLFAHESLGAYDFDVVDDGFDHSLSPSASREMSVTSFGALAPDSLAPDTDDPTLEQFPCDRSSVMDTLRRISTSMGEGHVPIEDRPLSPRLASRRTSVDSNTDSLSSPGSLSPTSSRKRDSRLSHSSFVRTKSAVSLGSIVEEPPREAHDSAARTDAFTGNDDGVVFSSDDEGPGLKGAKVSSAYHTSESHDSQASRVALPSESPAKVTLEPRGPEDVAASMKKSTGGLTESKWFITGGMLVLALGITWWKSCRA